VSQSYVSKRAISKRDRSSIRKFVVFAVSGARCSGAVAVIIRVNRRTAGTVAMRPLNELLIFLAKCSNTVRRNPGGLRNGA
jgi:hypothetical protein